MNDDEKRRLLLLKQLQELEEDEREELDAELRKDPGLAREEQELEQLFGRMDRESRLQVTESLLQEARMELRAALRTEQRKRERRSMVWDSIRSFLFTPGKLAVAGGLATLGAGVLLGYLIFSGKNPVQIAPNQIIPAGMQQPASGQGGAQSQNVQVVAVTQVPAGGNGAEPQVKYILAYTLLHSQNDGDRIQSVNEISLRAQEAKRTDPILKDALITAALTDPNDGVRKQAVNTLAYMPFDAGIKDTYLSILRHDRNPGVRIAAMNNLNKAVMEGYKPDERTLKKFQESTQREENKYILSRAASFVQEARQQ